VASLSLFARVPVVIPVHPFSRSIAPAFSARTVAPETIVEHATVDRSDRHGGEEYRRNEFFHDKSYVNQG
jgi:hypothetical protein